MTQSKDTFGRACNGCADVHAFGEVLRHHVPGCPNELDCHMAVHRYRGKLTVSQECKHCMHSPGAPCHKFAPHAYEKSVDGGCTTCGKGWHE